MLRQSCKLMFFGALLLALSAGWLASASHAGTILPSPAPVTLSSLLAQGATYTVGDKKFSGFSYLATGDMPVAGGINVAPIIDVDGNFSVFVSRGRSSTCPPRRAAPTHLSTYMVEATRS